MKLHSVVLAYINLLMELKMCDVIKLSNNRWDQEEFFTISDAVLIASGLDSIFNTIEEFQDYAEEILQLYHIEADKIRNGKASEMKFQSYSKISECNLAWSDWTEIYYGYISFEKITELNELTIDELHELKMQVKKHISVLNKLVLSGKLGDEYIEQLSSITKKHLDVWLIDSINGNYLNKSLVCDFQVIQGQPIEATSERTISSSTTDKKIKEKKGQNRHLGLLSVLMHLLLDKPETTKSITRKEDLKNFIVDAMENRKDKPVGLSKRSIEDSFSDINSYREKFSLPQFP